MPMPRPWVRKSGRLRCRGVFYKPMKVSKTIRIDADVLAWLQRPGKGYQKRLNAVLREAMLKEHEREE